MGSIASLMTHPFFGLPLPGFGGLSLYSSQSDLSTNHCRPLLVALSVPRLHARCNDSCRLPDNSATSWMVKYSCMSVFYTTPIRKLFDSAFGIDRRTEMDYTVSTTFKKLRQAIQALNFSTESNSDTIFLKPSCTLNDNPPRLPSSCFLNVVFKAYKAAVPFLAAAANEVVVKFNTRKANKELGHDAARLLKLLMSKDLTSRYGCPNEKVLVEQGLVTIDNKARGWGLEIYSNEKACREAGYYIESTDEKERRESWEASQEVFWARHNSMGVA